MFNFHAVNTAEVNASSLPPAVADLSINPGEDTNALSWTSPYFTDFFTIYWSDEPFTSIDEPGVHEIDFHPGASADPLEIITYIHTIPAAFGLSVLYYSVAAYNENGQTLSNQVTSYNFRLAIYEDIYKKTLNDLTLRFTPEIRKQYEDSELWRSFVQSLASELAQGRFNIKEAVKQLNVQKAVGVFLNMWYNVIGIARVNVLNPATGIVEPEDDTTYRQRLVDNIFWDKISNLALKKTMLLKLGYDADVLDAGANADIFRNVPGRATQVYTASHGSVFIPGEVMWFLRTGPNSEGIVVSDTADEDSQGTLTYVNYIFAPMGTPSYSMYALFGATSWMFANPIQQPPGVNTPGPATLTHDVLYNPFPFNPAVDVAITFTPSGATAKYKSNVGGILSFELTDGSPIPLAYDLVQTVDGMHRTVLKEAASRQESAGEHPVNSKLLSNIYSVNLGVALLDDAQLNDIYDSISIYGAIGNVLIKILTDVSTSFDDWNIAFGNIPYGPIFMGAADPGAKSTHSNWSVGETLYFDNDWTMADGKLFYGNDGPDDIVALTRTT